MTSICEPCESCDVSPKTALDDETSKEVVFAEVEVWDEDGPVLWSGSSSMLGNESSPDNITKKLWVIKFTSFFFKYTHILFFQTKLKLIATALIY